MIRRSFLTSGTIFLSGIGFIGLSSPIKDSKIPELLPNEKEEINKFRLSIKESLGESNMSRKIVYNLSTPVKILKRSELNDGFSFQFTNPAGSIITIKHEQGRSTIHIS